jgi:hypothetical protein
MRNPIFPKIESRIPSFITREYPAAHKLIVDFYKWLETNKNFIYVLTKFKEDQEVNRQVEPYVDLIISELGWFFDKPITVDKKTLVLLLRDFYLSRGSENSFRLLFRVLFGEDAAINYPRERLFVLSDATYSKDHWILTTATNLRTDIFDKIIHSSSLSLTVKGQISGTALSIDKVVPIVYDGKQYLKILVSETELDFKPLETVVISDGTFSVYETILPRAKLTIEQPGKMYRPDDAVIVHGAIINGYAKVKSITRGGVTGINIINPGQGYAVGDQVKTKYTGDGTGFFATISKVGSNGEIQKFKIWSTGYDYSYIPSLEVISETGSGAELVAVSDTIGGIKKIEIVDQYWGFNSSNPTATVISNTGTGAVISVDISGCISRDKLSYKNEKGILELNCILHDSDYFQQYSYEVHSKVASSHFNDIVDDLLHPVGLQRYNVYFNEFTASLPIAIAKINEIISLIGLNPPSAHLPDLGESLENVVYMNQRKNSTLFSINNIDLLKFSSNFSYKISDFSALTIQDFMVRSEILESRTIDPEISTVNV